MGFRLQSVRPLGRLFLDCALRRLVSSALLQCVLPGRTRHRKPFGRLLLCTLGQVLLSCLGGLVLRLLLGNAFLCGSLLGRRLVWLAHSRVFLVLGWGLRGALR